MDPAMPPMGFLKEKAGCPDSCDKYGDWLKEKCPAGAEPGSPECPITKPMFEEMMGAFPGDEEKIMSCKDACMGPPPKEGPPPPEGDMPPPPPEGSEPPALVQA